MRRSLCHLFFLSAILIAPSLSLASLSTQTGSSAGSIGRNQLLSTHSWQLAESLTAHPALVVNLKQSSSHLGIFYYQSHFRDVGSILTQNEATSGASDRRQSVDANIPNQLMFSYQYAQPLSHFWWSKSVGLSIVAPLPEMIILDSTSSFLPKYYWYDSRLNKTEVMLHLGQRVNENVKTSLSIFAQWDVITKSEVITGIQGSDTPSSARIQAKLKPRFFPMFETLWTHHEHNIGFSLALASKQKLKNTVTGRAPLGGNTAVDYAFVMESQSNVEPLRFRYHHQYQLQNHQALMWGIDYEDWSNLQSTKLEISQSQGVVSNGPNYETIHGKKILSYAMGMEFTNLTDGIIDLSYRFHPEVLSNDLSSSGNAVDSDKHIFGLAYKGKLKWSDFQGRWSIGGQLHLLESHVVTKTPNQEDGSTGNKIGSPGYKTGGYVAILGLGFEQDF